MCPTSEYILLAVQKESEFNSIFLNQLQPFFFVCFCLFSMKNVHFSKIFSDKYDVKNLKSTCVCIYL